MRHTSRGGGEIKCDVLVGSKFPQTPPFFNGTALIKKAQLVSIKDQFPINMIQQCLNVDEDLNFDNLHK